MGIHSVYYWIWVAVSLYAAYLICCCMYRVDKWGVKTDERIAVPRVMYLLTFLASFMPILNMVFGCTVVVIAVFAYYAEDLFYFRTWLFDKPKEKNDNKDGKE